LPGRSGDKPLNTPHKTFCRVLAVAGVEHLRIHDLRHSFASLAVNAGARRCTKCRISSGKARPR